MVEAFLTILTLNCRGLMANIDEISKLCVNKDIVCLQEHWLQTSNLDQINTINENFRGIGVSPMDSNREIHVGRPYGGVAILWNKSLDTSVVPMDLNLDWICGIMIKNGPQQYCILSVYFPYECYENLNDFINCLSNLSNILSENECTCVYILGDYNSDIKRDSLFRKYLSDFVKEIDCVVADYEFLSDGYTYLSESWGTTSWIDHCISSQDAYVTIKNMYIDYDYVSSDHFPLIVEVDVGLVPRIVYYIEENHQSHINWENLSESDINHYQGCCEKLCSDFSYFNEALLCHDTHCSSEAHREQLEELHNNFVSDVVSIPNDSFKVSCDSRKKTLM